MKERNGKKYQICNTLATGGTAVLYKAIQTSLDRPVVIKRLHSHLISDPNFTRRFELEAKAVASLDHENIVRIIDFGSSESNYYIVMEYIDGPSLKDVLSSRRVLTEELTLLIAHEICMGLDHAHQRGIIHRDVKPANIMITNEGQVKITDFGLAKLHQSQTQQTVASTLLGTPLYMSPEQAIGDMIDGRSDLFSLGTICYEAITGTQPFLGENYAAVIQNIINGNVPAPSRIRKDIGPDTETIIMKALNREPGKRFRNALEMARAIESLLGQDKILAARERLKRLASGEEDITTDAKRPPRTKTRKNKILPLGLTAAVAAGIFLMFALKPQMVDNLVNGLKALRESHPVPPGQKPVMAGQGEALPGISMTPLEEASPVEPSRAEHQTNEPPASADTSAAAPEASQPAAPVSTDATKGPPPQSAAPIEPAKPIESPKEAVPSIPTESQNVAETPKTAESAKPKESQGNTPRSHGTAREEVETAGYIEISVEPSSEIFIDGEHRLVGNHLGILELPAGMHEIRCRSNGYRDYVESVQIQRGELSRRRINLEEIMGTIILKTMPGAQVFIDGVLRGTTPLTAPLKISVGSHNVQLKKVGYRVWESAVYAPPDEPLNLKISLLPLSSAQ